MWNENPDVKQRMQSHTDSSALSHRKAWCQETSSLKILFWMDRGGLCSRSAILATPSMLKIAYQKARLARQDIQVRAPLSINCLVMKHSSPTYCCMVSIKLTLRCCHLKFSSLFAWRVLHFPVWASRLSQSDALSLLCPFITCSDFAVNAGS